MKARRAVWETLLLGLILLVGAALRVHGLNWDDSHWLHPDERQIYFTTIELGWPSSLAEALSPDSPLNPGFFAYGSFPLYLLKLVAALLSLFWPALGDPDNLHLVGRPLAALFDLGSVYLTFRLACILLPGSRHREAIRTSVLLAAGLAGLAVLHIQLAHFYTADPLLTFFVLLTLNLAAEVARRGGRGWLMLGIAFGLAMATKITAVLLVVPISAACYVRGVHQSEEDPGLDPGQASPQSLVSAAFRCMLPTLTLAALVFFAVQPYVLIDWQTFLADTVRESQIAWGWLDAPYTRQYAGTLPYLYSMWQTALWGMALPLGLVAWTAFGIVLVGWLRRGRWADTLPLAWAGPYLAITGLLYARYLRYMLPLVPILFLLVAQVLSARRSGQASTPEPPSVVDPPSSILRRPSSVVAAAVLLLLASLAYALAFVAIYTEPHSWITASEWIYRRIPVGSTLAVEEWDTTLPLPLDVDGQPRRIEQFDLHRLALYDEPDDLNKWRLLTEQLAESDYLIIASRRLYGSIPRQQDRYPLATRYYELLFAGDLGFELAEEFTRGPTWLNPRLAPLPGAVPWLLHPDESFVVYDHPRTLVFHNAQRLPANELLRRLQ